MAEFEELRLTVNLVDNASSGLQRLRAGLGDLTKSTDAMTQSLTTGVAAIENLGTTTANAAPHVRSVAQASRDAARSAHELKDGFMRMNVATQGLSSLPAIAGNVRDLGFAVHGLGTAFSLVGTAASVAVIGIAAVAVAVVGLGAVVVAYGVSVFKFAGEMEQLSRTAKQMGLGFASLKYATDQAKQFGYSADMVIRSYQGIQAAQLDLYKNNSQLRATLLGQGVDAGWIAQLSKLDPNQARSAIIKYSKQLEAQALASGAMKGNAARLKAQFLKEFGLTAADADMPELKPPSPEKRAQLEEIERYSKLIRGVWGQMTFEWTKFKTELLATSLPILRDSMIKLKGRMPEILKELKIWIEYAVSFLPGLVGTIPTVVKKVGVALKGVISLFQGVITALKYMTHPWDTLRKRAHPALQKLMGWDEYMSKENEDAWAERRRHGDFTMWDKEMWSLSRKPTDEEVRAQGMEPVNPSDYPDALTPATPPTPPPGQYGPRQQGPWVPPHQLRKNMSYSGGANDNNPLLQRVSFTQNELKDEVGSGSEEMAKLTRQLERLNDYIDRAGGGGGGGGGGGNVINASFGGSAGAAGGGGFGGGGYSGGGGSYGGASRAGGYTGPSSGSSRSSSGADRSSRDISTPSTTSNEKDSSGRFKDPGALQGRGPRGKLNDDELYKTLYNNVPTELVGVVPKDGARFGITKGTREEWAKLQFKLAQQESSGSTTPGSEAGHTGTAGLYQMEQADLNRWGGNGSVTDPNAQIRAMNNVFRKNIIRDNAIGGQDSWPGRSNYGAGAYFGPLRDAGMNRGTIARHEAHGAAVVARNEAPTDTQTANAATPPSGAPTATQSGGSTTAGKNPDGTDYPETKLAPGGGRPDAFITHHTSGGPKETPQSVVDYWRRERPGIGSQYIMDRDGVVHDVKKEFGYGGTSHTLPAGTYDDRGGRSRKIADFPEGDPRRGLENANVVGMEIIASDDAHVKKLQAESYARFMAARYPTTNIFGHGEINIGHKERDEGLTAKRAALALREQPDRSSLTADKAADVQTDGKLTADVRAPSGTKVEVSGSGAFKNTETSKTTTMSKETANKLLATN